jgi:hypothetical protein
MTEAAHLAGELADKLEQCIGEALRVKREREQAVVATRRHRNSVLLWVFGVLIALALAAGTYLLGRDAAPLSHGSPLSRPTVTNRPPK